MANITEYDEVFENVETEGLNKEEVVQVESLDKELSEIKEEKTSEDNISEMVIDKIEEKMSEETQEYADSLTNDYNISFSAVDKVDSTTNTSQEYIEEAKEALDSNVDTQEYTISKDSDTNEFVATDSNDNEIARDKDLDSVLEDVKEDFTNDLDKQIEDTLDKTTDEQAKDFDDRAAETKDIESEVPSNENLANDDWGNDIKDSINEGLSQAAENAQDNSQSQEAQTSNDSGMER